MARTFLRLKSCKSRYLSDGLIEDSPNTGEATVRKSFYRNIILKKTSKDKVAHLFQPGAMKAPLFKT